MTPQQAVDLISLISNDRIDELGKALAAAGAPLDGKLIATGVNVAAFAAYTGKSLAFEMLLDAGAHWHGPDEDDGGRGIVLASASRGHRRALQLALSHGADPEAFTKYGDSALIVCARLGNHGCLLDLLGAGANPNATDPSREFGGHFAIQAAASSAEPGSLDCLRSLIDAGASPNTRSRDRYSPLHSACLSNCHQHAALLIERGAKTFLRTKEGQTPLDLAIKAGAHETIALLQALELSKSIKRPRKAKASRSI